MIFLNDGASWLLDTRKDVIKKSVFMYFLVCKGPSNDDVGVARSTVFQEMRGGELVSKPAISRKKSWGGYRSKTLILLPKGMASYAAPKKSPKNAFLSVRCRVTRPTGSDPVLTNGVVTSPPP